LTPEAVLRGKLCKLSEQTITVYVKIGRKE